MVDPYSAHPFTPASQTFGERPSVSVEEKPEATVISAKFSDRDILTVRVVADKLLSDCWSKACEFARNFDAPAIEIHHLLLGASHIRDAEPVLTEACDNIAELTRQLSGLCAHRLFAETPKDNASYEASQALRAILCEAAAIAAKRNVPNLTLALVIEALGQTEPRPEVLDVLPKLQPRPSPEALAAAANARALEALAGRMDSLDRVLTADMLPRLAGRLDAMDRTLTAGMLPQLQELKQQTASLSGAITSASAAGHAEQQALLTHVMTWLRDEIGKSAQDNAAAVQENAAALRQLYALLVEPGRSDMKLGGGEPTLKVLTADQLAVQLEQALRPLLPPPPLPPTVVEEPAVDGPAHGMIARLAELRRRWRQAWRAEA